MSAKEHLEELLSGFLDGKLTPDELREVQTAMAADATLGEHVEQLRQIGNDLRSVPQRKLPVNFSQKVLAAIQVEVATANRSSTAEFVTPVAEQNTSRVLGGELSQVSPRSQLLCCSWLI